MAHVEPEHYLKENRVDGEEHRAWSGIPVDDAKKIWQFDTALPIDSHQEAFAKIKDYLQTEFGLSFIENNAAVTPGTFSGTLTITEENVRKWTPDTRFITYQLFFHEDDKNRIMDKMREAAPSRSGGGRAR